MVTGVPLSTAAIVVPFARAWTDTTVVLASGLNAVLMPSSQLSNVEL